MNGHLLHEVCRRCKTSWEMMFQTFKSEISANDQSKFLTIEIYIRFLDKIQAYIPIIPGNNTNLPSVTSAICTLM
jgi:hypothetical protein